MKERPILFSAEMVKAILDGRKTMTRRVCKYQPSMSVRKAGSMWGIKGGDALWHFGHKIVSCPYGQPGDRLWVRETFGVCTFCGKVGAYRATPTGECGDACWACNRTIEKWKPPIFMPRWASRIALEITAVRVERVQDIGDEDAEAEGLSWCNAASPRDKFQCLWNSLNAKRGYGWDANPWVWVLSFKRVKGAE